MEQHFSHECKRSFDTNKIITSIFFLYSDEAFGVFGDGVEFGAFSIGNTLYVFAWFPVFFIFMAIYA